MSCMTGYQQVVGAPSEVVVGLDFGSTFSGFAWATRAAPEKIQKFYDWPNSKAASEKAYCKTKTCLWYKDGRTPGSFELQAWGHTAFLGYSEACENFSNSRGQVLESVLKREVGYLVTLFKSLLVKHGPSVELQALIPKGLTVQRMISDFLREIGALALKALQSALGNRITKAEVQWCITVPGIFDESAKQTMKTCVEMAGLVQGPACKAESASSFPLLVVLEPEAASVHCQQNTDFQLIQFNPAAKFLVIDIGGYTVDLLIHEKMLYGSSSSQNPVPILKMREVTKGTGDYCGGSLVDERFLMFLRRRISGYDVISKTLPQSILKVLCCWEKLKSCFDGTGEFPLVLNIPSTLAEAWEAHERGENGVNRKIHDSICGSGSEYNSLTISVLEMKNIFEPSVKKILNLINKQIHQVPDLYAVTVVGGFSASPYLKHRISETLPSKVASVNFSTQPSSAICCGAVAYGLGVSMIASRDTRKMCGTSMIRPFHTGNPFELVTSINIPSQAENTTSKQKITIPRPPANYTAPKQTVRHSKRLALMSSAESATSIELEPASKYSRRDDFASRIGDVVPKDYRVTRKSLTVDSIVILIAIAKSFRRTSLDLPR